MDGGGGDDSSGAAGATNVRNSMTTSTAEDGDQSLVDQARASNGHGITALSVLTSVLKVAGGIAALFLLFYLLINFAM
mgnify:CR=1 FL=1|jgi:hypothetical protein